MGVTSSASIFIGFIVSHSDFWTEQTTTSNQPECENGHRGLDGKFCQDCGGKIEIQSTTTKVPTPKFEAYCKANGLVPEEAWNPETSGWCLEEQYSSSAFSNLELKCVDATDDSEHKPQFVALGKKVCEVDSISGRSGGAPNAFILSDLATLLTDRDITKVLWGIDLDRPIKLFLTTYCSY